MRRIPMNAMDQIFLQTCALAILVKGYSHGRQVCDVDRIFVNAIEYAQTFPCKILLPSSRHDISSQGKQRFNNLLPISCLFELNHE